jgi:organic radical activating enzyme
VYCCKQYSSAWTRDIKSNGSYLDMDRFQFTKIDQILERISQKEHQTANSTKILHQEIAAIDSVDQVMITGGEPFLYNSLPDLVNSISSNIKIKLYSGLGVNTKRFCAQLDKIKNPANIIIVASAENLEKFYEFNRFGNSYQNFLNNLQLLESNNWYVEFASTVSNLTVYGRIDFLKKFENKQIYYDLCYDPDFLSVNVLDLDSKDKLIRDIENSSIPIRNQIIQTIMANCTQEQKTNFGIYVREFARRRNLSLDIYPVSLLNWINNVV